MITAHWWPLEELEEKLALQGCRCHHSRALDMVRLRPDGRREVLVAGGPSPEQLYGLDHPQCKFR